MQEGTSQDDKRDHISEGALPGLGAPDSIVLREDRCQEEGEGSLYSCCHSVDVPSMPRLLANSIQIKGWLLSLCLSGIGDLGAEEFPVSIGR